MGKVSSEDIMQLVEHTKFNCSTFYSEVNIIDFSETYLQVSVHLIVDLEWISILSTV